MNCKLCQSTLHSIGTTLVLKKYNVTYFKCPNCSFIQTESPFWLDEAYTSAIAANDIGLVSRNNSLSQITKSIILSFFDANQIFLDYGGGYGMFVRMMRDRGFNFFRQDYYCQNLFAQGFDITDKVSSPTAPKYELLTAFEVFEHLVDPLQEIENMLTFSDNILFSTLCVPSPTPNFNQWWYYSLDYGQHIALYQPETLRWVARKFGLTLLTNEISVHMLSKKKVSNTFFKLSCRVKLSPILHRLFAARQTTTSLIKSDYKTITGFDIP